VGLEQFIELPDGPPVLGYLLDPVQSLRMFAPGPTPGGLERIR